MYVAINISRNRLNTIDFSSNFKLLQNTDSAKIRFHSSKIRRFSHFVRFVNDWVNYVMGLSLSLFFSFFFFFWNYPTQGRYKMKVDKRRIKGIWPESYSTDETISSVKGIFRFIDRNFVIIRPLLFFFCWKIWTINFRNKFSKNEHFIGRELKGKFFD